MRDEGDEGGTRRLERKKKERENICLMREEREVNKILLFFLATYYSAQS